MNSIDLKSLMIGILSCALVFMLMGLSLGSNGNYQLFCLANSSHCAVLNSDTGVTKRLKFRPTESEKSRGRPLKLLNILVKSGGSAGSRTPDHLIKSHVDTNNNNN